MTLHVVYRSTASENAARRPAFYSKDVALASFQGALEGSGEELGDVVFLNDGDGMPPDRVARMRSLGEVTQLAGLGNSGSYRFALTLLTTRPWSDDDLVYFSEDDYLYRRNALGALGAVARAVPEASYFTLYDYPGFHAAGHAGAGPDDQGKQQEYLRRHRRKHWRVDSVDWRAVRSTTMSFGARVGELRRDAWIHLLGTNTPTPDDGFIWDATHSFPVWTTLPAVFLALHRRRSLRWRLRGGLGFVGDYWTAKDRLLLAPSPGLATHLHLPYLAPDVDWDAEAARARLTLD